MVTHGIFWLQGRVAGMMEAGCGAARPAWVRRRKDVGRVWRSPPGFWEASFRIVRAPDDRAKATVVLRASFRRRTWFGRSPPGIWEALLRIVRPPDDRAKATVVLRASFRRRTWFEGRLVRIFWDSVWL